MNTNDSCETRNAGSTPSTSDQLATAQATATALGHEYATNHSLTGEQRTQLAQQLRQQVATVDRLERLEAWR